MVVYAMMLVRSITWRAVPVLLSKGMLYSVVYGFVFLVTVSFARDLLFLSLSELMKSWWASVISVVILVIVAVLMFWLAVTGRIEEGLEEDGWINRPLLFFVCSFIFLLLFAAFCCFF